MSGYSILNEALDRLSQPSQHSPSSQYFSPRRSRPAPLPLASSPAPFPLDPSLTQNELPSLAPYSAYTSINPVPKVDQQPPAPLPNLYQSSLEQEFGEQEPKNSHAHACLSTYIKSADSGSNSRSFSQSYNATNAAPPTSSSSDKYAGDEARWRALLSANDGASIPPSTAPSAPHSMSYTGHLGDAAVSMSTGGTPLKSRSREGDGFAFGDDEMDDLFEDSDDGEGLEEGFEPGTKGSDPNLAQGTDTYNPAEDNLKEAPAIPGLTMMDYFVDEDGIDPIRTPPLNTPFAPVNVRSSGTHSHHHQNTKPGQKSLRDAPPLPDTPHEVCFPSDDHHEQATESVQTIKKSLRDAPPFTSTPHEQHFHFDHQNSPIGDTDSLASARFITAFEHGVQYYATHIPLASGAVHPTDAADGLWLRHSNGDDYDPEHLYQSPPPRPVSRRRADQTRSPSPTESQLAEAGFEFHNEISEAMQVARFGDKAFRKALREVSSGLSRKEQWYAWRKVVEMLTSDTKTKGEKGKCTCNCCAEHCQCPADKCQCDVRKSGGAVGTCVGGNTCACLTHATPEDGVARERITDHPVGPVVLHIADGLRSPRQQSQDPDSRRPPSNSSGGSLAEAAKRHSNEMAAASIETWPRPELVEQRLSQQRAKKSLPWSPLRSLPPKFPTEPSGGRISRPDTPRPIDPSVRKSVEPETPLYRRHRESTPAFEDRSQTPSPVARDSSAGEDVLMMDAGWLSSASDPLSSPSQQRVYTAPETPVATTQSSPLRQSVKAPAAVSKLPKSTKRKDKERRKSAVVGGKVDKSRNVTRKVTVSAKEVERLVDGQGLVKKAVEKIEKVISKEGEITPRRSKRLAKKKW